MNPLILIPNKYWTVKDRIKGMIDPGYQRGRMARAYVAGDLSGAQKVILLCSMCKHGFDWKKHGYYNIWHYERILSQGTCDVCKQYDHRCEAMLHESTRKQCWMTKDETKAFRQQGLAVGF